VLEARRLQRFADVLIAGTPSKAQTRTRRSSCWYRLPRNGAAVTDGCLGPLAQGGAVCEAGKIYGGLPTLTQSAAREKGALDACDRDTGRGFIRCTQGRGPLPRS